jgi:beta-1,4-mannooligosaccharide/beta-1,4-mannosyl-N-acetylglucosamine phosphorylase
METWQTFRKPFPLFRRYEGNPILSPKEWPYPANAVFNPAAIQVDGETLLLVRVEDMLGFSHLTIARSKDGKTNWRIDEKPTLTPDLSSHERKFGLEDPRMVWLEDRQEYAITYVCFSDGGPLVSLMLTPDFKEFFRFGPIVPPEDKDACVFPRRFEGRYALIHRPIIRGEAHIWLAFSPDLKHWGDHQMLLPTRGGQWDCHRVGLGTQPIETPEGWLIIYHGVRATAAGSIYRVGLALLDLEDPRYIRRRSEEWVFGPVEHYELIGDTPHVTFPTGAIFDKNANTLRVYYGAADVTVALAMADMDDLMEYVMSCPEP